MLLPFSLGLGGRVGDGKQHVSWISINDCIRAIEFSINNSSVQGALNLCSPQPISNQEFSVALAKSLNRPCIFPLPEFIAKILFGQMGEELLLGSTKAVPKKLRDLGFVFEQENIKEAFRAIV